MNEEFVSVTIERNQLFKSSKFQDIFWDYLILK